MVDQKHKHLQFLFGLEDTLFYIGTEILFGKFQVSFMKPTIVSFIGWRNIWPCECRGTKIQHHDKYHKDAKDSLFHFCPPIIVSIVLLKRENQTKSLLLPLLRIKQGSDLLTLMERNTMEPPPMVFLFYIIVNESRSKSGSAFSVKLYKYVIAL